MINEFKKNNSDSIYIEAFHTQETRAQQLTAPCICKRTDAWLGVGYYFWLEEEFAHYWGEDAKNNNYSIYSAYISKSDLLDTTFNMKDYFSFRKIIEQAVISFDNTNKKLDLEQIHRYLSENVWSKYGIKGIIYDDMPQNPYKGKRKYSLISLGANKKYFYYKKRIQVVVFDLSIIEEFKLVENI